MGVKAARINRPLAGRPVAARAVAMSETSGDVGVIDAVPCALANAGADKTGGSHTLTRRPQIVMRAPRLDVTNHALNLSHQPGVDVEPAANTSSIRAIDPEVCGAPFMLEPFGNATSIPTHAEALDQRTPCPFRTMAPWTAPRISNCVLTASGHSVIPETSTEKGPCHSKAAN